jgi:two-component sensor histidine kinase
MPQNTDRYRQRMVALKSLGRVRRTDGSVCAGLNWAGRPSLRPRAGGFGTSVMENIIVGQLRGEVRFDWRDCGLACEITLPIA